MQTLEPINPLLRRSWGSTPECRKHIKNIYVYFRVSYKTLEGTQISTKITIPDKLAGLEM